MYRLRDCRPLRALLSVAIIVVSIPFPSRSVRAEQATGASATSAAPPGAASEPPPAAPPVTVSESLDRAREFIKAGDYDDAIETLSAAIRAAKGETEALRDAYLLLIKTWVFLGAGNESKQQQRETAKLNYQEGKKLIAECLSIKELRHTKPDPPSEYPEKMISLFAEVRSEMFGSFRVSELRPPDAIVLLDADTLRKLPGEDVLGDVDLPVGPHRVVVTAKGHKDLTQTVEIPPGSILEQSYNLTRHRSRTWYAAMGAAAAGVVTVAFLAGGNNGGSTSNAPPEQPLPGAPPPPAR